MGGDAFSITNEGEDICPIIFGFHVGNSSSLFLENGASVISIFRSHLDKPCLTSITSAMIMPKFEE